MFEDLRYALRQLRRSPGFACGVIVVLALGIGANAAMFTILEATLFRPLPFKSPQELISLKVRTANDRPTWARLAEISVWQARSHSVSQLAYFNSVSAYLADQNSEQQVTSVNSSSNLFATLGVTPALGRSYTADEQREGRNRVIVLSDAVWRAQFHADPRILGRRVRLDDNLDTVIGVMPPGFQFPVGESPAQVWEPVPLKPEFLTRDFDAPGFEIVGRRNSGVSVAEVGSELSATQKQLMPLYTDTMETEFVPARVNAVDYRRSLDERQRTALLALFGAVAVLWVIACANVASLMLARTAARGREMAVRSALGASRWRLVRQLLAEAMLLSIVGGALGLALSQITLRLFRHSLAAQFRPSFTLHLDGRVLLSLFALSIASALLFSLFPARLAARMPLDQALRQDGAQAGTGRNQHRLQRLLVVAELALTLALLVSCGLLLRTVFALRQVPLGFHTDHVFVIQPHLPTYKYRKLDPNALVYKPLLERIKQLPGVESAAVTTIAPLAKGFDAQISFYMGEGTKADKFHHNIVARMRASGPEFQKVLGFRMLRGRYFTAEDTPTSQHVGIVNHAFEELYQRTEKDVIGFSIGKGKQTIKIVGVVDDFHQAGIADPAKPELDMNAAQMLPSDNFYQPTLQAHAEIVLRSTRDPRSLLPELDQALRSSNPDLAGSDIRTMDQIVEDAMGSQLLATHLLEALGALALVIALAGLYSLLAYLVTLRTRELGLRLALGAQRSDILTLILRNAGVLLLTGTAIGIAISVLSAHLLGRFLFGVKEHDIVTLVAASALLLAVGTVAAWLPARRASALEPMQALRSE